MKFLRSVPVLFSILMIIFVLSFESVYGIPIRGPILVDSTRLGSFIFDENNRGFTLTFTGSAVTKQGQFLFNMGQSWAVDLVLDFQEQDGIMGDSVFINGNIVHIMPPDDAPMHNPAAPFMPSIEFNAGSIFSEPSVTIGRSPQFLLHLPHVDRYTQTGSGLRTQGLDIRGWNAAITGSHVPEPSTILLLGSGLAGLLGYGWRRRKQST